VLVQLRAKEKTVKLLAPRRNYRKEGKTITTVFFERTTV